MDCSQKPMNYENIILFLPLGPIICFIFINLAEKADYKKRSFSVACVWKES